MIRRHSDTTTALRPAEIALIIVALLVGGAVAGLNAPLIGDWIVATLDTVGQTARTIITFLNPF